MRRRSFLAASAGALAGLGGCSGLLGDGDSGDRGPAETVEAFFETAASGDAAAANEYVHPDSPLGSMEPEDAAELAAADPTIEEAEVRNRSGDTAEVRVVFSADVPDGGGRETTELVFELRRVDGEWLLWDSAAAGGSQVEPAPQAIWDVSEQQRETGVVALDFLHNGGDTVEVQRLTVEAGGAVAAPGDATGDLVAGDSLTVLLDADGDPLAAGDDVQLVWTDDAGHSSVIAQHTLTAATAGGLADRFEV